MCGCGPKYGVERRDNLVMCSVCPKINRTGASRETPATCSVDGKPVLMYVGNDAVTTRDCPIGRHAGKDGVLTWMGLRWYGVPAPIRWYLRFRPIGKRLKRPLSGCGCVKVLKDRWTRIREKLAILPAWGKRERQQA